jgi:acyl-CoA thioesterase I
MLLPFHALCVALALCIGLASWREAEAAPVRIVAIGDSITQGDYRYHTWRRPLWQSLTNAGFSVDFVGSTNLHHISTNQPGRLPPSLDFDLDHEGHWEFTADALAAALPGWLTNYPPPDIALLHAGTRDCILNEPMTNTVLELKAIIDILRSRNPRIAILLAKIIPTTLQQNANVTNLNAQLDGLAASKITPASPVIIVDQYTGFNAGADTYDGIRPSFSGETKLAQKWFTTLRVVLQPPRLTRVEPLDNNTAQISATGVSGVTYRLLAGTNLLNWTSIATNTASPSGTLNFTDPGASTRYRFYQIVTP